MPQNKLQTYLSDTDKLFEEKFLSEYQIGSLWIQHPDSIKKTKSFLHQRQLGLIELVRSLVPEEKPQLDKNDPDNYGACYAIGGFNHCREKILKNLEK